MLKLSEYPRKKLFLVVATGIAIASITKVAAGFLAAVGLYIAIGQKKSQSK